MNQTDRGSGQQPGEDETIDELDGGVRIIQGARGYRYTSDSIDLAGFVKIKKGEKCADLGAGSGVITILLAKKHSGTEFTAIELQADEAGRLQRNISLNGLEERVGAVHADLRRPNEIPGCGRFDLAFSNPPYRRKGSGRLSVKIDRAISRQEINLTISETVHAASRLLKNRGRFCLIYPADRLVDLVCELRSARLEPKRIAFISRGKRKAVKLAMVEALKGGGRGLIIII